MISILQQPVIWSLSATTLFLFAAAAAIFLLVLKGNFKAAASQRREKPLPPTFVAFLALASNFLGVASVVLLGKTIGVAPRYSMLALPVILLTERYGRSWYREHRKRPIHAAGLAGAWAGVAAGAAFLFRAAPTEPIVREVVPRDVATMKLVDVFNGNDDWAISVQLLVFYVVSLAIFFGLHSALTVAVRKVFSGGREKRSRSVLIATAVAFAANFGGVAAVVYLAKAANVEPRLAMVLFPLFLIAESYTKQLRAEHGNRRPHWSGLIGTAGGVAAAALLLLRDAPIH